jgi:hypothetical protein
VPGTWRLVFYQKRKSIPFPDMFVLSLVKRHLSIPLTKRRAMRAGYLLNRRPRSLRRPAAPGGAGLLLAPILNPPAPVASGKAPDPAPDDRPNAVGGAANGGAAPGAFTPNDTGPEANKGAGAGVALGAPNDPGTLLPNAT